jgi:adenylate cyclase
MRRPILSQVRSFTGVIIGTYVTLHLLNHALGLISLDAQETARPYFMAFWHSPPGQLLLYGSLILHAGCALSVLWRRRTYALPIWEGTQIILGLTIPYLLLVHIVNTRGTRILTGIDINYPYEIANLWIDPWLRAKQILSSSSCGVILWSGCISGCVSRPGIGAVSPSCFSPTS